MIFERSRDITRGRTAMKSADQLVIDFTKVPFMGFRSSRKIATTIKYAHSQGLQVSIVGASAKIRRHLGRLGIFDIVHSQNVMADCAQALQQAMERISRRTSKAVPKVMPQAAMQLF